MVDNIIILSNTCVGQSVIKSLEILPYNNPFIATLIPNDNDYIKLINNLSYYITLEPNLGNPNNNSLFAIQNNSKWYKHIDIIIPYPVIYIGDIEIHCIHENNNINCLEKFTRRFNRIKEIIKLNNYKIFSLLSFSEMINDHDNLNNYLDKYFLDITNIKIEKYFIGPSKLNVNKYNNYIEILEWDLINLKRDESHVYKFNNQEFNINNFYKKINFI